MNTIFQGPVTTWLRTDQEVVSVKASVRDHLPAVEAALHDGVAAVADTSRPGFYEIEIGNNWYYIHIPKGGVYVYLVAARRES